MTEANGGKKGAPTMRDRMRPLEMLGLAAAIGVFVGLVVGLGTREWILAAIFFGVIFIVSLVALAMLSLAIGSPRDVLPDDHDPIGH